MSGDVVTLLVVGGMLEFGGIFALAWPDLVPWKERVSGWMGRVYRKVAARLRRMFGRTPLELRWSDDVRPRVWPDLGVIEISEDATLEAKVAFLLSRDQAAQRAESVLQQRIGNLERAISRRLDEHRAEMMGHFSKKLTEALNRYRSLRILGAFLLAAGLLCLVAASFV